MDEPDYVETSDPEELQIIQGVCSAPLAMPIDAALSQTTLHLRMSRKRRKLFHVIDDHGGAYKEANPSSERSVSQDIDNRSTTPVRSPLGLSISTAISNAEQHDPTELLAFKELDLVDGTEHGDNGFDSLSQMLPVDAVSMDTTYDTHDIGSQDELDVISQSLSQAEIGSAYGTSPSHTLGLDTQQQLPSSSDQVAHEVMNTDGDQPHGPFFLFSSEYGDASSHGDASLDNFPPNSTPLLSPRASTVTRPRYSSLPPSSPPQTSTSIPGTPPRSLSLSPGRAGFAQPQSQTHGQDVGNKQLPSGHKKSIFQFVDEDDDGMATRRYSLRTREARQLNPYEYDKRLYKQQMRRMPDAIVKVVSPRRHDSGRTHRRHESQEEDEFIVSEDEDNESQETTRRRRKGHRSSDTLRDDYEGQEKSLTWLPKAFHMSDDDSDGDLTPLSPGATSIFPVAPESEDLRETHKSRHKRLHKFPLKGARVRKVDRTERDNREKLEEVQGRTGSAITYTRRKDARPGFQGRADRSDGRGAIQLESELCGPLPLSPPQTSHRYAFERPGSIGGDNGLVHHDVPSGDRPARLPSIEEPGMGHGDTFNDEELENNAYVAYHHDGVSRDNASQSSRSDIESDTDSDLQDKKEAGLSRRDRKRMRQLHRMLPAVMVARLQGQGPVSAKRAVRSRSKSVAAATDSSDENDEENSALAPGRSRIRKRSSTARADPQIRGDSESSGPELGVDIVRKGPQNMIYVESSSESDMSTVSSLNGESDDEKLEKSIADAGYFDQDFTRQPVRRREEPLIDMMLCRTRTNKGLSRTKARKQKSGASARAGGHGLKNNGLDVSIPESPSRSHSHRDRVIRGRQTRLPFESATGGTGGYPTEDMIDLTNVDTSFVAAGSNSNGVTHVEQLEPLKKLTKKQRQEAAQKSTLHTIASHGKKFASGRKRGFMNVQIDMADDGLRQALNPLRLDRALQIPHAFSKTTSARAEPARRQKSYNHRHCGDSKSAPKQTSLYDFASNDEPILDEFEFRAPKRRPTNLPISSNWQNEDSVRTCSFDMSISAPTPGLAFGASTYLGKQLLPHLLDFAFKNGTLTRPSPYVGFGLIDLHAEMAPSCFVEALEVACNMLSEWLDEETAESTDEDNVRRYEHLMYSLCYFAAWMLSSTNAVGRESVQTATLFCAGRLTEKLREEMERSSTGLHRLDLRRLAVMWFVVELTTRMLAAARRQNFELDGSCWRESVTLLIKSLIRHGMRKAMKPIETRDMSTPSTSLRAAELWVCIIHLLPPASSFHGIDADSNGVFWSIILQAVKENKGSPVSNIEVSEHLWSLIFSLSALSHFSAHGIATTEPRLPPCWEIVGNALDTIRLTDNKEEDSKLPRESLKRRDRYVRMVVARCFVLGTKWNWPLRDAYIMFKKLVDIFKSRNFANLLGEEPEFPAFLRYHNAGFLDELRTSDTAFSLYLKLVVQATKADPNAPKSDARTKSRVTKLLSLAVPLSGVAFSKAHPPTTSELPMLINRFSAIVIAILVDGKENANIRNRLSQARRFISFVDADDRSRDICIKAVMYMAIAINHLSLELDEPLKWLGDMCQTLLEEFQNASIELQSKGANARNADSIQQLRRRPVISLHLLLRCVRNIIERPNMGTEDVTPCYPSIGLLNGPWVKKIFSMKELTNMVSTRLQILQLVQSFLKARMKVIPPPRRPAPAAVSGESSESQDMFVEFGTDEDMLALVLMDDEDKKWRKDKELAEIMNSDIVPHIFRLLLQYFNDPSARPSDESRLEEFWGNADDWIDCWVGCAAIVVRDDIRDWSHYLNVGPQSWGGISDPFFRRRVAVRFMYQLLRCDPTAYNKDNEEHFLIVLLQCLVAYRITMENEYLSKLFSVDGLRHIMLRNVPVNRVSEQEEFHLTRADFLQVREAIITRIFSNLDSSLDSQNSERDKNVFVECVVQMLSAMQDIWKNLASSEDRNKYGKLCRHVFSNIRMHARVHSLQRLASYLTWGASFDEPVI